MTPLCAPPTIPCDPPQLPKLPYNVPQGRAGFDEQLGQILAFDFQSRGCGVIRTWTFEFAFDIINNRFGRTNLTPGYLTLILDEDSPD